MQKYYDSTKRTNDRVWFKLLDKDGRVIKEQRNDACFSTITYYTIPAETVTILIYHAKDAVPYSVENIERWIKEINELGFPCSFEVTLTNDYHFTIKVADYVYKTHLVSTLMFIRCLYETGIAYIPERYFQLLDEKPDRDKFEAIQIAHKTAPEYFNWNHTVTSKENGSDNVTKDVLWGRYAADGYKVLDGASGEYKRMSQMDKWKV